MQQQRLFIIRNLLSLHSLAMQMPKYTKIIAVTAVQQTPSSPQQQMRHITLHRYLTQAATTTTTTKQTDERKQNKQQQKITLIGQNQSMSITTLEEAQKLAKRRDLHILRQNQTEAKTGRAIYKLVTAAEMLADDVESKDTNKSSADKIIKRTEKSLSIGARITDHDLASRLKNIAKWLHKRHEVRILIQGNVSGADEGNAERIVKTIETTIKVPQVIGKIVQKRQKGSYIKFNILPMSVAPTTESTTTTTKTGSSTPNQS